MSELSNFVDRLNHYAVESLGVAVPQLSPQWAAVTPAYNGPTAAAPFTLTFAAAWFPPFTGVYANRVNTAHFNTDGSPITGNLSVLRFHPQAAARLADLYAGRFGSDTNASHSIRPVPASMLLRLTTPPPSDAGLTLVRAGDQTAPNHMPAATVSFHDLNGLLLDPIAVAAAFVDLLTNFPLLGPDTGNFNPSSFTKKAGWLDSIAALDLSVTGYVHVVDPHGGPWQDPGSGMGLTLSAGGTGGMQRFTGSTPLPFTSTATVQAESTGEQRDPAKTMVRFGYATWGMMGNKALSLKMTGPAATTTIKRDFVRLAAVDLNRFLLGNRSSATMDGVPALDSKSLTEPSPLVREGAAVRLHTDGMGVVGEAGALLTAFKNKAAGDQELLWLVSPAIDDTIPMPADTTTNSRWGKAASANICPADITPTALPTGDWSTSPDAASRLKSLRPGGTGCTATWASATGTDVLVTIEKDIIPKGAHVRVYNRLFVITPDLASNPTLFRGDGAARIAGAGKIQLVLENPLNLSTQPGDATLHFDLHVLPNNGAASRERVFGGYALKIAAFAEAMAASASGLNLLALVPQNFRGVCTSRFLGLSPGSTLTWPDNPADVLSLARLVRGSMSVTATGPFEAPRYPTMARYESVLATAKLASVSATPVYNAVLSGGFFTAESHCELYHRGNPGGPATAETHVAGLFADNWLGRDLALSACRRGQDLQSRLISLATSLFDDPASPTTPSTISGAVLQTVAAGVETPELVFIPESSLASMPNTVQQLQDAVNNAAGGVFTLNLPTTPGKGGDRVVAEIKREAYAAHYGRRDWQTALRYALAHARELIYLETQCLVASSGIGEHDYSFDVIDDAVSGIAKRLAAQPSLRLVVVSPKVFPYGSNYQGWAQHFYEQRTATWAKLTAAAPGRVLAVHPIGFPGRPLNVRTSVCIIDDVWASIGTAIPRRRGLSFDGSIDVSLVDAHIANGRGVAVAKFRRDLMAQILDLQQPGPGMTPALDWTRLAHPRTAFQAFADLVAEGGRGLVEPSLWAGPDASANAAQTPVKAMSQPIADPEGREAAALIDAIIAVPAILPEL